MSVDVCSCPLCGHDSGMIIKSITNELQCPDCGNIFTMDAFEKLDILDMDEYREPLSSHYNSSLLYELNEDQI